MTYYILENKCVRPDNLLGNLTLLQLALCTTTPYSCIYFLCIGARQNDSVYHNCNYYSNLHIKIQSNVPIHLFYFLHFLKKGTFTKVTVLKVQITIQWRFIWFPLEKGYLIPELTSWSLLPAPLSCASLCWPPSLRFVQEPHAPHRVHVR